MGDSINGQFTGQQKLEAIQKLGIYKSVPNFDSADASHQYEINLAFDTGVANGTIAPYNVDSIAHVEATSPMAVNANGEVQVPTDTPVVDADAEAAGGVDVGQQ